MIDKIALSDNDKLEVLTERIIELPYEEKERFVLEKRIAELNLPPSAIEETRERFLKDETEFKIRAKGHVVPLRRLVESPAYEGEMIITSGRVAYPSYTGLRQTPLLSRDDPQFLIKNEEVRILCRYGRREIRSNEILQRLDWSYPRLYKITKFRNGERILRPSDLEELYVFLKSAEDDVDTILVGGVMNEDVLLADMFQFDKNNFFRYSMEYVD